MEPPRADKYIKTLAEDTSDQAVYGGIPCAVQINDFTMEVDSVKEVSLSSFESSWDFELEWEPNCEALKATVKVFDMEGTMVGSSSADHAAIVADDWSLTVDTDNSNLNGVYTAKLTFTDTQHETQIAHAGPLEVTNVPLCHLFVDSFDQSAFEYSVDEAHFELSVNAMLSHKGDKACTSSKASVSLMSGADAVFTHELSATDLSSATSTGFDFTIVEDVSANVTSAVITYSADDTNGKDATANFDVVAAAPGACEIEIENFCLVDVVAGADEAADATFDFSLIVRSTPSCGELDVSVDIVQEGTYLGNVVIDAADIVSAVECNCETTFHVSAPASVTGEFYGQIDVREPSTGKIYISDSTPFTAQ